MRGVSKGTREILLFAGLGLLIGYTIFSPLAMLISDLVHDRASLDSFESFFSLVYLSLTEVFAPKMLGWALVHTLLIGIIGALVGYFYRKFEKNKEEAERQKNKFDAILSTMTDGVAIIQSTYEVEYLNQAFLDRFGNHLGEKCYRVFAGRDRPCPVCPIPEILERGKDQFHFISELQDGGFYETVSTPLRSPEGTTAIVKISREITERKKMERQILQTEKMVNLGQMAAGIAHQVGNPLSSLSGIVQVLLSGRVEEGEREEYLQAMSALIDQIDRTLRNLLDFSRPAVEHNEAVEVNELIEEVVRFASQHPRIALIRIERRLCSDRPEVLADRGLLTQVFFNLILNAAEAMAGGGVLRIKTLVQRGQGHQGRLVQIAFTDQGDGIAEEDLPKIFDLFFTTKPPGQGTGLGLAVTRRIIESYNGAIRVESRLNVGTKVIVSLPEISAAGGPSLPTAGDNASGTRGGRRDVERDDPDYR